MYTTSTSFCFFFPPRILDKPSIPLIHEMESLDGSSQATIFSAHCESTRLGACSSRDMGVQLAKNGQEWGFTTEATQDNTDNTDNTGRCLEAKFHWICSLQFFTFVKLSAPRFRNFPKRIPCCTTLVYAFPNL